MLKKHILTSIWSVQHLNAGQNIQQTMVVFTVTAQHPTMWWSWRHISILFQSDRSHNWSTSWREICRFNPKMFYILSGRDSGTTFIVSRFHFLNVGSRLSKLCVIIRGLHLYSVLLSPWVYINPLYHDHQSRECANNMALSLFAIPCLDLNPAYIIWQLRPLGDGTRFLLGCL